MPGQIERAPVSPLVDALRRRWTAHDSDNVVFGRKHAEQSGSYVATRSGDHDAHCCASDYLESARGFVGGVFGRLLRTGRVVGVAGVATV